MPPGSRETEGPRVKWFKGIHDAMAERGVVEGQWMDRGEWQLGIG
jgi:hypothetical protein